MPLAPSFVHHFEAASYWAEVRDTTVNVYRLPVRSGPVATITLDSADDAKDLAASSENVLLLLYFS